MTDIDLDAIRAREQAAERGPWRVVEEHGRDIADEAYSRLTIQTAAGDESLEVAELVDPDHSWSSKLIDENAEFIAHARTDVSSLLREVDRLRSELDIVRPVVEAATAWAEACEDVNVEPRPREDALYDAVKALLDAQESCGICSGYGCPDCLDDETAKEATA